MSTWSKIANYWRGFPNYIQYDQMSCGATCLKIISEYYGREFDLETIVDLSYQGREGVSLLNIKTAAESLGFVTFGAKLKYDGWYEKEMKLPAIIHWKQEHFVVLYKIKKTGKDTIFYISDPAFGKYKLKEKAFKDAWLSSVDSGIAFFLEPDSSFYDKSNNSPKSHFLFLIKYLKKFKGSFFQLAMGMLLGTLLSLSLPILTQKLVDYGVLGRSLPFIILLILSQFAIYLGQIFVALIRSWIVLHANTRISLSIISDFLMKLFLFPISYFDRKTVGDFSQRISDHHRIEEFLTSQAVSSIFSLINLLAFSVILYLYDKYFFFIYIGFSLTGIAWILLFQKKRKELDYLRFDKDRLNKDKLVEMIGGIQEIKLYGSEDMKRKEWEEIQASYFRLNVKGLALEQYQVIGMNFFNQIKNLAITFLACYLVVNGNISVGTLLGLSFIIGQTSAPLEQIVSFIRSFQDANISIKRLQEVLLKDKAEIIENLVQPQQGDIVLSNLSFQYEGPLSPFVLKDINLRLEKGTTTAIVGVSGSGKTTILKLLLGFYKPVQGEITLNGVDLSEINPVEWRKRCGVVMQNSFMFSDSIKRNITMCSEDEVDEVKYKMALKIANLEAFIKALPLKDNTKVGVNGIGISGGESQRIVIARSVYKSPEYIFFDEATSSLDANNETLIVDGLKEYLKDKTAVIIAHRLSTVKNADKIVVLKDGGIIEEGTYSELLSLEGEYFNLVKKQLEIHV